MRGGGRFATKPKPLEQRPFGSPGMVNALGFLPGPQLMTTTQGIIGELAVQKYFSQLGYKTRRTSLEMPNAAIDLVAAKRNEALAVEVKTDAADNKQIIWRIDPGGNMFRARAMLRGLNYSYADATREAMERKQMFLRAQSRVLKRPVKGLTFGVAVDYKKMQAHLYRYEGFKQTLSPHSEGVQYIGAFSVKRELKEALAQIGWVGKSLAEEIPEAEWHNLDAIQQSIILRDSFRADLQTELQALAQILKEVCDEADG